MFLRATRTRAGFTSNPCASAPRRARAITTLPSPDPRSAAFSPRAAPESSARSAAFSGSAGDVDCAAAEGEEHEEDEGKPGADRADGEDCRGHPLRQRKGYAFQRTPCLFTHPVPRSACEPDGHVRALPRDLERHVTLALVVQRLVEVHHRPDIQPVDLGDDVVRPEPRDGRG